MLRWLRDFPGEEGQLRLLRRWLEALLPECPARDDVISAAGELSANAVAHTASGRGGSFTVEVTWWRAAVRVAVADDGAPTAPHVIQDTQRENGRGLMMVRGLSARTGVTGDERGRLVWAEVLWTGTGAAGQPRWKDGYEAAIAAGGVGLASRYPGAVTWFGRATLQWWGLARRAGGGGLVAASSPQELAWRMGLLAS
jgi:hypothetical protein